VAGSCECGNKPLGPIICGEFLDSAPWSEWVCYFMKQFMRVLWDFIFMYTMT